MTASLSLGDAAELVRLMRQAEGNPVAMVALARAMDARGEHVKALELGQGALDLAPENAQVRAFAAEVMSARVPSWHFEIVRDDPRNDAYEAALRRSIFPGCRVLEIGTGTSLLAMMAARAGAAEVITCESEPAVANTAREIIARNGYADRVRVVAKHSSDLDVKADLNGPVDILVSEIVSNDLLSEGTLPVLEHAVHRFLKPGAKVIPARGRVRVALADDDDWDKERLGRIAGFDLSAFNKLAVPYRQIYVGTARITLRSDAADLFSFDFASGGPFPEAQGAVKLVAHGRRVTGIAQWIALDMDDTGVYENRPEPGTHSSWWMVFHPFARPLQPAAGQEVGVAGHHDRTSLRIWKQDSER